MHVVAPGFARFANIAKQGEVRKQAPEFQPFMSTHCNVLLY